MIQKLRLRLSQIASLASDNQQQVDGSSNAKFHSSVTILFGVVSSYGAILEVLMQDHSKPFILFYHTYNKNCISNKIISGCRLVSLNTSCFNNNNKDSAIRH